MNDQEDGKAKNLPATANHDIATQASSNSLVSRGIADLAELGERCESPSKANSQTLAALEAWMHGPAMMACLHDAAKKLLAMNGRAPLITELAAEVEVNVELIVFIHRLFFAQPEHHACKDEVEKALSTLGYREREVLKLVYGLGDGYSYTYDEVAHIFQVSVDEIQEDERSGMQGVLSYFGDKLWDATRPQPPDTPPAPRR